MAKEDKTQTSNSQQSTGNTSNEVKPQSYGTTIIKKSEDSNVTVIRIK
jgi:hypothetical protein